ncbi:abortive infection family protein [Paenibacillus terrae]|uniref:abortive infection family protein n=1 Tax=Paenibacillus terrae TaxID=159743 RepID=UPI0011EB8E57|nr:abortive infection family protein [Paenibacillus terrae]
MIENPYEIISKVKNHLKKCVSHYECIKELDESEYTKCRLIILRLCKEEGREIPKVLRGCLDMDEFLTYTYDGIRENSEALLFIQETFNPFIDIVRERSIAVQFIPVEFTPPKGLYYNHIESEIKKCDRKILEQDYAGAITNARSLLEGVLKEIIFKISGTHPDPKKDLVKLHNDARSYLNLDPSKPEIIEPLKQVITGLASTVQGLGTIRNVVGDSHSRKYEPDAHHAILVVNAAKTLASFLFGTYEYQISKGFLKKKEV